MTTQHKTHFSLIGRKNKNQSEEFYRKIGFRLECQFVEMCTVFLLVTKWTMQALIQHVYSFHLLHSISVCCVFGCALRCGTSQQRHCQLEIERSKTIARNNADNSNGNTIDEHHLLGAIYAYIHAIRR